MNSIDKEQVNELIHCKVSTFKNDLIEQLRRLIEHDEISLELNLKQLNSQRSRLLINKRKFSSSEDDELENSNSVESNAKSDHDSLNLNKILNIWKSEDEKCSTSELECNEKLIDKDVLSIANHLNNLSNSLSNHPLSPFSSSTKSNTIHHESNSATKNSESIEKSFNETFSCLNGVSIRLIGNIRLQLTTPLNSNSSTEQSSLTNCTENGGVSLDRCIDPTALNNLNNSLLMISECLKSSSSSSGSDRSNSLSNSTAERITSTKENDSKESKNQNFNIDQLIRDESSKRTFALKENDKDSAQQSLINQQLSASNDSSSSTLSAVSIDLSQTNSQQLPQQSQQTRSPPIDAISISSSQRRSSSSTASASSDRDCLTPPNRKHLKTEPNISTSPYINQSLNLITSMNSINMEPLPSPYLSPPSLPQQQQLNELLSPNDSLFKAKKISSLQIIG